ncbi:MAG TPA: hypothetical protein VLA00_07445 [Xanthobacteraceae bacterium]|nr:hypothetical protein [Xanthobacteraceae bacterium]
MFSLFRFARVPLLALAAGLPAAAPALAQQANYGFESPPSPQANRVYSVNVATGEITACQYERPDGNPVGVTRCFARSDGAGPQKPGSYALISTHYSSETGVFRVNRDSGEMSVCYVRDVPKTAGGTEPAVVCTPPSR